MATQVKRLKNLSLIVVVALVITLAPALSVIGGEVITLTTIMPSQDTLRVKRGAVGLTYRETATLSNDDIGDDNLLIEGNVGIGTTVPISRLHVRETDMETATPLALLDANYLSGGGAGGYDGDGSVLDVYTSRGNGFTDGYIARFRNSISTKLYIRGDGNVGIGTTSPGAKLEVAGQVKITGGTPGANKVLTSDANGLASWKAAGGGQEMAIRTGSVSHGGTIPLPTGYTQAQCKWFVSTRQTSYEPIGFMYQLQCYANSNRVVTCRTHRGPWKGWQNSTANYMIIGIK